MLSHLILLNFNFSFIVILILFQSITQISCHGRLIQPPGRSTAWRYGFPTVPNYNDNQLFCGGFTTQWDVNGGKCGICGDSYSGPKPNELPDGKYTKPLIITQNYTEGETISVLVQLTANHRGKFVLRLCPAKSDKVEVTQECLDSNVLTVLNSVDGKRDQYTVPDDAQRTYDVQVILPKGLTCNRCVLQWTYTAGNNWGRCDDGTSATGCGPQETFRACADVRINSKSNGSDEDNNDEKDDSEFFEVDNELDSSSPKPSSSLTKRPTTTFYPKDEIERESVTEASTRRFYSDVSKMPSTAATTKQSTSKWNREKEPTTPNPASVSSKSTSGPIKCISVGKYRKLPGMDQWCADNCIVGFCPASHCKCE